MVSVMFSFNPTTAANTDGTTNVRIGTSATTGEYLTLPKGAVPISITTKAVATGGTNPTVDIGFLAHSDGAGGTVAADPDGMFNELDADSLRKFQKRAQIVKITTNLGNIQTNVDLKVYPAFRSAECIPHSFKQ